MKKFLLTIFSALALQFATAQYYYVPNTNAGKNPGGINTDLEYPPGGGLTTGWATIHSGPNATAIWSSAQTLPFAFSFNGASVTSYVVSSSGIVTFTASPTGTPPSTNVALPNAGVPDKSICVLGLNASATGDYVISKTFGTAPNRQQFIQFNSCSEPNLGATGWVYFSIVLEETSNKIYIVDQRSNATNTKLSIGIQINSTTAVSVAGSPNIATLNANSPDVDDNSYYEFIQGTQPVLDITATKVNMPDFLILSQAPFTIAVDLKNLGTAKVTTLDLNYSINGGATVTAAASGISMNSFGSQLAVAHLTKWTPTTLGTYTVKIWASNINGGVDANTANDAVTKTVTVVSNFVSRVILNEVFTSSTCGPCVAGNINYKSVTDAKDPLKFTTVKYQGNFPGTGDPYYTSECATRYSFYGVSAIPHMDVDGGWNGNAQSFTSALFDQFQAKPAFMTVTGTSSIKWRTVSVTANIKPLTAITSTTLSLFVAVCEKTTTKNLKTNGETEFDHVMKKMLPNGNGTPLTGLADGIVTTKTLNFTFPGVYTLAPNGQSPINLATQHSIEDFNNLEVVMWVQDMATKEVWQSGYTTHTFLGIDKQISSVQNITILPNPTTGLTKVNFGLNDDNNIQVSLVDALGKTVKVFTKTEFTSGPNSFDFDATGMATGVYFIKFVGDNFATTQKFVVN